MDELLKALAQNPIALVAFGLGSAMLFAAVRKWGLLVGEHAAPSERNAAQVAAVIVDPTSLNAARDAVNELTETIQDGQKLEKDHVHMICRRLERPD